MVQARFQFLKEYACGLSEEKGGANHWAVAAARGTALLDAAQLAFLINESSAFDILKNSAKAYRQSNNPFGYFLESIVQPKEILSEMLDGNATRILRESTENQWTRESNKGKQSFDSQNERLREQLQPTQLMYLTLAFLANRELTKEYSHFLEKAFVTLERHANHPMGSQGFPIEMYLRTAREIFSHHVKENYKFGVLDQIPNELKKMSASYGQSLGFAKRNTYLWKSVLSPIDLVDFDIVGITTFILDLMPIDLRHSIREKITPNNISSIPMHIAERILNAREDRKREREH